MGGLSFPPSIFTSANRGLVPASGGGTSNFLRADGAFASPGGGGGGAVDVLHSDATRYQSTVVTSEQLLTEFIVPGGTLANNGEQLDILVAGTFNTAGRDRGLAIKLDTGSALTFTAQSSQSDLEYWLCPLTLVRSGASEMRRIGVSMAGRAGAFEDLIRRTRVATTSTIDLANPFSIGVYCTPSGSAVIGDITCLFFGINKIAP